MSNSTDIILNKQSVFRVQDWKHIRNPLFLTDVNSSKQIIPGNVYKVRDSFVYWILYIACFLYSLNREKIDTLVMTRQLMCSFAASGYCLHILFTWNAVEITTALVDATSESQWMMASDLLITLYRSIWSTQSQSHKCISAT